MRKHLILILALVLAGCQSYSPNDALKPNEVKAAFTAWINDVNHKDMQNLLSLYDSHADLHPTLSGTLRTSRKEMEDYFTRFLALQDLHAEASNPHIQIFGNTAINDGFYTFSFRKNGKPHVLKARYSFTYLKEADGWKIVDHHSSVVPSESPQNDSHK